MEKLRAIGKRFLKVAHVILLLLGIPVAWLTWVTNSPYSYTIYSYEVVCDNGKTFDPTSKPIDRFSTDGQKVTFRTYVSRDDVLSFDENQVKSECEYGNAWNIGLSSKLPKNFQLNAIPQTHVVRSQTDQMVRTIIMLVGYYLLLEFVKRTFLYIFLGKNFLDFRKK